MSVLPPDLPPDWPHRETSRMIAAAHQRWHVQIMGAGPDVLLIHGAGGSLHGWRVLAPLLAPQYRVIALDVGGQGFSQKGRFARAGLTDVAGDIALLCADQGWDIRAIIGHSAGVAIALQLSGMLPNLRAIVGLNAALSQFQGVAGWLFPALAKSFSLLPFVPQLGARLLGSASQVDRLLAQNGANLDAAGRAQYLTLLRRPAHIAATLDMMAAWDLRPLLARLGDIQTPVLLLTGARDGAVPPETSTHAAHALPHSAAQILPRYGHLLPEEAAGEIAPMVLGHLSRHL